MPLLFAEDRRILFLLLGKGCDIILKTMGAGRKAK